MSTDPRKHVRQVVTPDDFGPARAWAVWAASAAIGAVAIALIFGCSPTTTTRGIPNLDVLEAGIVRSGQITTAEGWAYLAELAGARRVHVVKLNYDAEGASPGTEAAEVARRGWAFVYAPIQPQGDLDVADDVINAFRVPDDAAIARAKAELEVCHTHPDTDFCDLHCTHGQDRTGEVAGEYRVDHGWTKERAYGEMLAHHYHPELHGLHERWERYAAPAALAPPTKAAP